LMGRNAKTQWRLAFEGIENVAERRKAATNRQLIGAFDGYRRAYSGDLNHFWSGLAALQMCAIAKILSDDDSWEDAFDSEREAHDKKDELAIAFDELKVAVKLAIQSMQARLAERSYDRVWADIANADLLFLIEPRDARVLRAYKDTVPPTPWFRGAVQGQLELFASLGVRAELAKAIVAELAVFTNPGPAPTPLWATVIVAGHRIDEPGRAVKRFPESAAPAVKEQLRQRLSVYQQTGEIRVLASGAPGTDIICHELCGELGINSTMCLPMPVDDYSRETFADLDAWRSRFHALVAARVNCLQLSDSPGLPKWLQGSEADAWERGNCWVLQLALSADSPRVSLIAVWDGNPTGDGKGGTAHMVDIARKAGTVSVDVIRLKNGKIFEATEL
jgi:hypothetical protein